MKKLHKVIILAGIPGSGKSTYIEGLMKEFAEDISVAIVSADHYFIKDGTYKYVAHDIPHAHRQCQMRFSDALDMDVNVIFVDNTNILSKHRQPYVQEALDCDYEVEIHALPADVEASASRNIHGVGLDTCQRMFDSFDLEFGTIYDHKRQKIGTITKEQVGLNG